MSSGADAKRIAACAKSFSEFCKYLKIVDKRGRSVHFDPKPAQAEFYESVSEYRWVYILKARQLGMTTAIAMRNLWKAMFIPNFRVCVIAHSAESAQVIFEIYKRAYELLPNFLKFPTQKSNVRELVFFHGGLIRVATANSDSFRGTTYQSLHCSEFAFWNDVDRTIAAAFQTAGPGAEIVLETTANGINDAHRMWIEDSGFTKIFYGWTKDPNYLSPAQPKAAIPKIQEYAKKYNLTDAQYNWAHLTYQTKCAANWNIFLQEYPLDAEHAFITSGERYFPVIFPHAVANPGRREYIQNEPIPYHVYTMGVDVASGSPSGDYSAFCVMDVTEKKKPVVVATYYQRIPPSEFGDVVLREAKKWNALCVVESNTYGLSILEYLMAHEWAYIFRRTQYDKLADRWLERVGFNTNQNTRPVMLARLHEYISKEWLMVEDERMKCEVNTFIYNDKGKPEASSKKHDDMVFAYALALMGFDQIEPMKQETLAQKPNSVAEMLQFERTTGKVYSSHAAGERSDRWGTPYDQASLLDEALSNSPTGR